MDIKRLPGRQCGLQQERVAMTTEQNGQRAVRLDLLKALAITLVVFLHNAQLNPGSVIDNAFMMLCTSAVPVFFMVTGAIQLNRTGSINYRRHLMSIGRLYALVICWKVLYAAFMHFFYAVPIDGSLSNLVNYIFLFQEIPGVSTGHFWYFQALIALYFILPLLRLCREKKLLLYLMLLLFVFSCVTFDLDLCFRLLQKLSGKHIPDMMLLTTLSPFHPTYAVYILYLLLGKCIYAERGKCVRYRRFAPVALVLGLAGLLLIKYLQSGLWSWQGVHIVSGYYYASTMLIAAGLMLFFVGRTAVSAPEQWIGRVIGQHTLGIFFLHLLLYTVLDHTLYPRIRAWNSWYLNLLESLGIVILSALCTILFRTGIRAFTTFFRRRL